MFDWRSLIIISFSLIIRRDSIRVSSHISSLKVQTGSIWFAGVLSSYTSLRLSLQYWQTTPNFRTQHGVLGALPFVSDVLALSLRFYVVAVIGPRRSWIFWKSPRRLRMPRWQLNSILPGRRCSLFLLMLLLIFPMRALWMAIILRAKVITDALILHGGDCRHEGSCLSQRVQQGLTMSCSCVYLLGLFQEGICIRGCRTLWRGAFNFIKTNSRQSHSCWDYSLR